MSGRDVPGFGSGRPGFGKTLCKKLWADSVVPYRQSAQSPAMKTVVGTGAIKKDLCQGQVSAEGILHLVKPNLGSNSGVRIFAPRIWGRILGSNFWALCFPIKRALSKIHPQEIHRPKFTSKNSPQNSGRKIHIALPQGHLAEFMQLEGGPATVLQGHRFPLRVQWFGLQALRSPHSGEARGPGSMGDPARGIPTPKPPAVRGSHEPP